MPNLNASVIGSPEYSKQLGKKSGETDITFYDLKKGETTITMVEPSRYPEKIQSLYYSAAFGDHAVLVAEKLDQYFGESLLMINACGVKEGTIVLRNYITEDQLQIFRHGTVLAGYEVMEDDPMKLRDKLLALAERPRAEQAGPSTLTVDAAFNVRGIGTVALATVKSGTVKKHDELHVLPGDKMAEVRSIQKHDEDFDTAGVGDHVGLALKGVEATDLDRGTVLTGENLQTDDQDRGAGGDHTLLPGPATRGEHPPPRPLAAVQPRSCKRHRGQGGQEAEDEPLPREANNPSTRGEGCPQLYRRRQASSRRNHIPTVKGGYGNLAGLERS